MEPKHQVAFSGGKDSSAMLFRMIEIGMPVDEVYFCDTTKEFKSMYKYVSEVKSYIEKLGINFIILKPEKSFDDWFFGDITRGQLKGSKRGWPLMFFHCYWSREAKFKLMDPIMKGNERYIGFAADEKKRVKAGLNKGYNFPLADWGWTESDALNYLDSIGWSREIHHDFKRTGCFLCPKQNMDSLRIVCQKYPEEWKELLAYAELASNDFKPGVTFNDLLKIEKEIKSN